MIPAEALPRKSRLAALLDHFAGIEDPRDVRRILHPLPEILLLVVCGTIADCDDYEDIAGWGAAHLDFLRRHLPYEHGVPGERWLTILMNRINPALFAAAFAAWVRESWPEKASLVAIDGKTSRRSHDRSAGAAPLHLVSAFATTARLVLAQEAVPDKASELAAIPPLLERLGAEDGLKGALVSIDAVATNADIAKAIAAQGADWLLAVKANQPSLRAEVEAAFAAAPPRHARYPRRPRHGPRPHRAALHRRAPRDRLARWRPPLPGRAAPAQAVCLVRAETRVGAAAPPAPRPATSSPLARSRPSTPPQRSANTGQSRTACTGCSTSPSPTTSHASARATAPATWHRPPLRPQPRPPSRRQALHKVPTQDRRMGSDLPRRHPCLRTRLTWIRSPARGRTCLPFTDPGKRGPGESLEDHWCG
jgi:hypothetical protein